MFKYINASHAHKVCRFLVSRISVWLTPRIPYVTVHIHPRTISDHVPDLRMFRPLYFITSNYFPLMRWMPSHFISLSLFYF